MFDLFDKRKNEMTNDNTLFQTDNIDDIDAIRSIFTNKVLKVNPTVLLASIDRGLI